MTIAADFLSAEFEKRLQEKQAAIVALEAKERALTLTVAELQEYINGLMPELERRRDFDTLRAKARGFADYLEKAGY